MKVSIETSVEIPEEHVELVRLHRRDAGRRQCAREIRLEIEALAAEYAKTVVRMAQAAKVEREQRARIDHQESRA